MKNNYTKKQFIHKIEQIYKHMKEKEFVNV